MHATATLNHTFRSGLLGAVPLHLPQQEYKVHRIDVRKNATRKAPVQPHPSENLFACGWITELVPARSIIQLRVNQFAIRYFASLCVDHYLSLSVAKAGCRFEVVKEVDSQLPLGVAYLCPVKKSIQRNELRFQRGRNTGNHYLF